MRIAGRVLWCAEVEFAYNIGYDTQGQVSVNRIVRDEARRDA